MSLESDYELLEILRDDGVQSFRGREISTGRSLEIHLFIPFGRPENKILFERLKTLPLESRRKFLDVGTDGSTPYIVTDPLLPKQAFKDWVERLLQPSTPIASIPAAANLPPRATSVDESVQILQAGQWRTGTPLPKGLINSPKLDSPPLSAGPPNDLTEVFETPFPSQPKSKPGEFTGLFQASRAENAAAVPLSAGGSATPGEFTSLFEAKSLPPPPGANSTVNPSPESGPGEFTKFFENPLQPPPLSSETPDHATPSSASPSYATPSNATEIPMTRTVAPPPVQRGGEFTQVFGASGSTPPSSGTGVAAPASHGGLQSATGAFSGGSLSPSNPPPPSSLGPSEYTRIMSGTLVRPEVQAPPETGPASTAKSNTPLFGALGALAFLILLVVIYFVLRHG